jgi:transposase InsO family protein
MFIWPGMKKHILEFVRSCLVCQQAKSDRVKYPGLLLPLPVPKHCWHTTSLDFISGLLVSGEHNCILVVVDKFPGMHTFIPMAHPFTSLLVAKLYLSEVYKLHGLPATLISNRDLVFTSKLWQELFHLAGTKLCMSNAYHPQSDGQTERVNQCLETYLRCFIHSCPKKWVLWLPLAEYWYNTCYHSALGTSPFEVLYGHAPSHFVLNTTDYCTIPVLQSFMQERQLMLQQVKLHLQRAQDRMKK